MKDEEGRYVYVNRPYKRTFAVALEDWLGRTDFEVWPEEVARQFRANDLRAPDRLCRRGHRDEPRPARGPALLVDLQVPPARRARAPLRRGRGHRHHRAEAGRGKRQ